MLHRVSKGRLTGASACGRVQTVSVRSIDDWINEIGSGWRPLVRILDANLRVIDPDYTIDQVKEKFGGLRFYFSSERYSELEPLVDEAEIRSFKLCENCGEPGSVEGSGGWLRTLCSSCREKDNEAREKLAQKVVEERTAK